ncbi:MAG: WbqC family protein [Flavobacteriales bacterium]|nr:WbqC family protein [Flavobacteriales bacterium]
MKVAIMQPYFLPYIGYFQLINSVDKFIVYDDIEYTKKGWINRNRILANESAQYLTITIKKDSDYLNINERHLADSWTKDRIKLLNKVKASYRKAPYFDVVMPLIEEVLNGEDGDLFQFIFNSLEKLCQFIGIETTLIKSSTLNYNSDLKSQDKVLNICENIGADIYINPIGGKELYDKDEFSRKDITLKFLESDIREYKQFNEEFISSLSILDVMMFNSKEQISEYINAHFSLQ